MTMFGWLRAATARASLSNRCSRSGDCASSGESSERSFGRASSLPRGRPRPCLRPPASRGFDSVPGPAARLRLGRRGGDAALQLLEPALDQLDPERLEFLRAGLDHRGAGHRVRCRSSNHISIRRIALRRASPVCRSSRWARFRWTPP